jgi:hypothetical protein
MRGAEGVVFALGPLGEAGQAATLPQCPDAVAPAGQDLVRVGLMADVPDQTVVRCVENIMECHGQLDDAEAGTEMPPGYRDRIDGFGAQLVGNLPQIFRVDAPQFRGVFDRFQNFGPQRHDRNNIISTGAHPPPNGWPDWTSHFAPRLAAVQ